MCSHVRVCVYVYEQAAPMPTYLCQAQSGGIVRPSPGDPRGHTLGWVCQGQIQAPLKQCKKCKIPVSIDRG